MFFQPVTDTAILDAARRGAAALLTCAILVALGACSGDGNGGTDVTIGGGQSGDPVTLDFPVFYVKRPVPADDADVVTDVRELRRFAPGADLFMRSSASPSSPETNITAAQTTGGRADIRDVDVSFDGQKVVFSMRIAPAGMDLDDVDPEEALPSWDIWQYDVASRELRRVITSDNVEHDGHDIMPHYLPDGRIVFSSTRQRQAKAILLDENKPQYAAQVEGSGGIRPAFNLHVMEDDGDNIHQLSFNQSHDLDPAVLATGQIVFTRWEQAIDDSQMDLYKVNPDGSGLQVLYGANSHATGTPNPTTGTPTTIQFINPRAMQDGRTLALVRPFDGTDEGGDLVLINTENYVDCNQTIPTTTVSATPPCAAQARALPTDVRTIPGPSPGGRFRSAAPLFDGTDRLLVSWSQCRLLLNGRTVPCTASNLDNLAAEEAPPLYGVYVYDVRDNTQRPIVAPEEGSIYTEVVAGAVRALPPVLLDRVGGVDFPASLESESVGILHIRSVYDFDGSDTAPGGIATVRNPGTPGYATRPARFLRLEKVVSQPDQDTRDIANTAFGPRGQRFGMRDILGYAPVEPDGSVKVKVPANVPFAISVLDGNGRRIGGLHTNWLQMQVGETLQCNGCHSTTVSAASPARAHGRSGLYSSVNAGAPTTGSPFPNTNSALFADMGETMAETRGRMMCGGACKPSMNIVFNDYWPATGIAGQASYDACYVAGATDVGLDPARPVSGDPNDVTRRHECDTSLLTTAPTTATCSSTWSSTCRVTIHYPTHIHPLWSVDRFVDANNDGFPDVDAMNNPLNNRCSTCHAPVNAANMVAVPAGNLDLTDGASEDEPDHLRSYRELLFGDRGQFVNPMGQLEDECLTFETDPITNVVTCVAFRQVPASMSANGANSSARFFNKFDVGGGTVDHRPFLNRAELKLIAEWLDVGAQYYNNPFAAPED
jgi:Hydrazine synthase alpha subunit middle domain/WD40-like Beta Propeller Repeat